jgi:colanic acid/amylovoran biosynthesis glycosyltransferase
MKPHMDEKSQSLAILAPRWGAVTETFVRRHVTTICPGKTIVMARDILQSDCCPCVPLLPLRASPVSKFARRASMWRLDRSSWALRHFLEEHRPTAVMGEWLNFAADWFQSVRSLGFRFFAHAHGYDASRKALQRGRNRILYRRLGEMDGIITVSELTKRRLVESLRLNHDRIHVIPCGVELPPELPPRNESELVTCLCVGRMVEKKGQLQTLRAFCAAYRQCPRLRMEFIGAGPTLADCQRYSHEQGLSDVVTFHGSQAHDFVKQRLTQADIFLLHSVTASNGDEEGLPVAVLEGMAYELPVISTLHGGIPEAVLDGGSGFLVAEQDEFAMARRITDLAESAALRREMGMIGRKRVSELFSAEREVHELRRVLFNDCSV